MQKEQFLEILKKYQDGNATAEEVEFLRTYYNLFELEPEVLNSLKEKEKTAIKDRIANRLMERIADLEYRGKKKSYRWIAVAASILLFLSFGGYFILHKQSTQQTAQNQIHDVRPGGNKAILTLAGGKQVILTGAKNGTIAQQGNAAINKTANGQIVYNTVQTAIVPTKVAEVVMNTITTPRGGKWFVILSDGTKVWLNTASSITYPVAFTGNERKVSITGEAYFEVAHNAAKPFKVVSNGQIIEDIGTSFDINTYNDEPESRTTLVEGSVRVSTDKGMAVLKPGQQAQVKTDAAIAVVTDKDMERTLAWRNGLFIFNRTDLYTSMRQLSRWYDVDVVYQNGVKNDIFFGKIRQDNNLSQILKVLELGDVHFRIEGKKLIVLP